jgi:hypothetical protein
MKPLSLILILMFVSSARAQNYSIDRFAINGGGGTSTAGRYSVAGAIGDYESSLPMIGDSYRLESGFGLPLQTPGGPMLFITRSSNNALLFWSANRSDYLLQHNTRVNITNGWSELPFTPVSVNGFYYVTNVIAPGSDFYRLHRK